MPDITLKNQPFDVVFHPSSPTVYIGLLTGEVKAFTYDDNNGESSTAWTSRPTKRTARALIAETSRVWVGGKAGSLIELEPGSGTTMSERATAHEVPINRLFGINDNLIASGDDDGVIKFWDPRQEQSIRSYSQHYDYISDFTYFDDKRQLISTSGDGHLSAIDIRSSKSAPLTLSEDQDDELLSIVPVKGDSKCVVGSGLGVLSIWNRKAGWGDCVDRMTGHPASVDALVALNSDVIISGSEDGLIRVVQILPNKFLGVIATHNDYPIERMALDRNQRWLASVSHDDCLKLTDLDGLLEDSEDESAGENAQEGDDGDSVDSDDEPASKKARKGENAQPQDSFFADL